MSKTLKILLAIILVIVVLVGGWWYMSTYSSSTGTSGQSPSASSAQTNPMMVQTGTAQGTSAGVSGTTPVGDTSDASLNQDAGNIDAQINGLNSDGASATQSLNAQ